jgi:oligosaccharide repeat unit polymerase
MPAVHTFPEITGIIFICAAFISHYTIDISLSLLNFRNHISKIELKSNITIQNIGLMIMMSALPLILYKLYLQIGYVKNYGYLTLFNGEMNKNVKFPFWTTGSGTLFVIGFLMVLMSYPQRKIFLLSGILYIIFAFTQAFKGSRELFVVSIISIFYFYSKLYKRKISIKVIIGLFMFIIVFSIGIGNFRVGKKQNRNIPVYITIMNFLYSQGTTIGVPLTIIDRYGKLPYHPFPFIFSWPLRPLFNLLYPNPLGTNGEHSKIDLEKHNRLSSITISEISSSAYMKGYGYGGSFLAEMYDCGKFFGVIFWSIMLALLLYKTETGLAKSNMMIPMNWLIVYSIIYLPRNYFFDFLRDGIVYLPFLCIFLLFIKFIIPEKIFHFYVNKNNILYHIKTGRNSL